jgi:arylsulfatase A-like enzyme
MTTGAPDVVLSTDKGSSPDAAFAAAPELPAHSGWEDTNNRTGAARYQRPAPHHFRDALQGTPLSPDTASLYAMLAYFDQQLGRLLDFLESSPLGQNTYVLLSGDNGPALFSHESKELPRAVRMPSGMQGSKHDVLEGGIRNILAVRGPGVPEGSTTNALLGLVDVLPTLAELAGVSPQVSMHTCRVHLPTLACAECQCSSTCFGRSNLTGMRVYV